MLTRRTENEATWYGVSVAKLDTLLKKSIHTGKGYRTPYELRKNISYSLQYLEYLDRNFLDLKFSSVIHTQLCKSFVITGCGIIESLLHFLLISKGHANTSEWELVIVAPGNTKNFDGETRKVDSHIYKKLPSPKLKQMNFDTMIQKSISKKVLGNCPVYNHLRDLKDLRNKVHLQNISGSLDTDWNSFGWSDAEKMGLVIREVFRSNIFHPSDEEKDYFNYLDRYQPIPINNP